MASRSLLLVGSFAVLFLATAGGASAQDIRGQLPGTVDAYATGAAGGASFTSTNQFGDDASFSGISLEGGASAEYNATATLGFQGDVRLRYYDHQAPSGPGAYGSTDGHVDAAAHAFYRNREGLLGGFVQISRDDNNFTFSSGGSQLYTYDDTFIGLEAQKFIGNVTLYGQVAALRETGSDENPFTGFVGTAELRYFLTPNFRLGVHGQLLHQSNADGFVAGAALVGIDGEYRLDASPVSFTASLNYTADRYDNGPGGIFTENALRALVGLKVDFGSGTLEDQDRTGASLKPIPPVFEGDAGYLLR
jgi:hypothetical protein